MPNKHQNTYRRDPSLQSDDRRRRRKKTTTTKSTERLSLLKDPDVEEMAKIVGAPDCWAEAVRAASYAKAVIELRMARTEADKVAGSLYTRDDLDVIVRRIESAAMSAIQDLPEIVAGTVVPAERPAAKRRASEWVTEIRRRWAEALGE